MSSTHAATRTEPEADLVTLRAELDGLDDALHDAVIRRAEVVARIAALRAKGRVPLRPAARPQSSAACSPGTAAPSRPPACSACGAS